MHWNCRILYTRLYITDSNSFNFNGIFGNFGLYWWVPGGRNICLQFNPFVPTVAFSQLSSNICCPRDCVSQHNGGTSGAPLKPLRVDSALKKNRKPNPPAEGVLLCVGLLGCVGKATVASLLLRWCRGRWGAAPLTLARIEVRVRGGPTGARIEGLIFRVFCVTIPPAGL